MKTLILVAFWKRIEISVLFWYGIQRLKENFDIQIASIVSDEENKSLAKIHSDFIIEHENKPMGRKLNNAMTEILINDFDFLMQMGSDNLISDKGMETNMKYMNEYKFFGHTNLIIVDSMTKECKLKRYGNVFGAGRCIHKSILEKCTPLWADDRERGLDVNSEITIEWKKGKVALPINDEEVIDIKSDENIWKFSDLQGEKYEFENIKNKISEKEFNYLKNLCEAENLIVG